MIEGRQLRCRRLSAVNRQGGVVRFATWIRLALGLGGSIRPHCLGPSRGMWLSRARCASPQKNGVTLSSQSVRRCWQRTIANRALLITNLKAAVPVASFPIVLEENERKKMQQFIIRELVKAIPVLSITLAAAIGTYVAGLWPLVHASFCGVG